MKLIAKNDDKDPDCMLAKVPSVEDILPELHTAAACNHRDPQQSNSQE